MKSSKINIWKQIQNTIICLFVACASQEAVCSSLLSDIDGFLTGHYPVATAYLSLYDSSGAFIEEQKMDATDLLMAGFVNSGTEILFNGSLTFPDVYPFSPGGVGGQLASVHDFSVDLNTAYNSPDTDLVTMQIDWLGDNQSVSDTWGLTIGDDFVHGIAYYSYGGYPPKALDYGYTSFSLEFATGYVLVPLPGAAWLFGTGILGLAGVARQKSA